MFTIDLLKGGGIPQKSKPVNTALATIPFVVPVVIAIIMIANYIGLGSLIAEKKAGIARIDADIKRYAEDVEFSRYIDNQIGTLKLCMAETAGAIKQYLPFSTILQNLVENMPDPLVFKKLDIRRTPVKKSIPDPRDPSKKIKAVFIKRTLQMSVCDISTYESNNAIKEYIHRLNKSSLLTPIVKDIRIVSSKADQLGDRDVTRYDIDCLFKLQN